MLEIIEYNDNYKSEWDEYILRSDNSTISHLIAWKEIFSNSLGHTPKYLIALDEGIIKGLVPLMLVNSFWSNKYLVSLPWIDYGGICVDNALVEQALVERLQQLSIDNNVSYLELRSPKAVNTVNNKFINREDKVTFLLPLESDFNIVWDRFNGKLKNQIRKSIKSELIIEFGKEEKLKSFYKVFSRNMRDLGTPVWGIDFFEQILRDLHQTAQIILVKKNDYPIAGGFILSFKDRLYVPSASSYRSSLKYCPNHALYWAIIKMGCEKGYKFFDFGRSSWDSNTFNFKKQWMPTPTQLTWQYYSPNSNELPILNQNKTKFNLASKIWTKLPLSIANFLGPKIIKNFP